MGRLVVSGPFTDTITLKLTELAQIFFLSANWLLKVGQQEKGKEEEDDEGTTLLLA